MPLFICKKCNVIENTALGSYWGVKIKLCSECSRGKWHNQFKKEIFDPKKWHVMKTGFLEEIKKE